MARSGAPPAASPAPRRPPHPDCRRPSYSAGCPSSNRLERGGASTGVGVVCTLHSAPGGAGLDVERLYWDLSHETHGVTRLGSYTLDRTSLYVNGEGPSPSHGPSPGWSWLPPSSEQSFPL